MKGYPLSRFPAPCASLKKKQVNEKNSDFEVVFYAVSVFSQLVIKKLQIKDEKCFPNVSSKTPERIPMVSKSLKTEFAASEFCKCFHDIEATRSLTFSMFH